MRLPTTLVLPLLALACRSAPTTPPPAADPATAVRALADQHFEQMLRLDPLMASEIGDHRYDDRLPDDLTESGREAKRRVQAETRERLAQIPRSVLSGEDALTWDVLDDMTRTAPEAIRFDRHLMPVQQMSSIPVSLPLLGAGTGSQPFATVADYEHFLGRIAAFDHWVDTAIGNMRQGMATGFTQPRPVMARVLPQLDAQLVTRAEDSVFWGPITRMPEGFDPAERARLTAAYRNAIHQSLVPSYRRLRDFVRDVYLPACRTTTAVEALPDGRERYAFEVRRQTTTELDAHAIHLLGLREVSRIVGEVDVLQTRVGFQGTPSAFLKAMLEDPRGGSRTEAELIEAYRGVKGRIVPRLPLLFSRLPRSDFDIRPVEKFRENSAPSNYTRGTPDGTRPGIFYANASSLKVRPSLPSESLFLHEALPGHHFQMSLTNENDALPRLRRFAEYNAYIEGWGLYAERLGSQLGVYQDDRQKAGQLKGELFRAARLVVDTGLHHEGWSRERAIDYLVDLTGDTKSDIELEVDRYLAIPAQALGYKVGELSIRRLRDQAERALGPRFDIRAFHQAVLESGALPLGLLEKKTQAWIAERSRTAGVDGPSPSGGSSPDTRGN
jgi:uncharacterized protein (DUF885 family)